MRLSRIILFAIIGCWFGASRAQVQQPVQLLGTPVGWMCTFTQGSIQMTGLPEGTTQYTNVTCKSLQAPSNPAQILAVTAYVTAAGSKPQTDNPAFLGYYKDPTGVISFICCGSNFPCGIPG